MPPTDERSSTPGGPAASRRDFLQQAAGLAAGLATAIPAQAGSDTPATAEPPLPTVALGKRQVTRLIVGGNPIYGHSHFNRLFSRSMTDWHTPERVVALLKRCEQAGINCWQNSYTERTMEDLERYRAEGGAMHWLSLGKTDWDEHPERIAAAAKHRPIGLAPHGGLNERLHREGKLGVLTDLLKRIRDQGVLVGLSAHNPALIELAEEKGWDVDYYMCCLYYLTRPREEVRKLLGGELPLGEVFLESDPPRMFRVVRSVKKPCLVYKVFAAGRRVGSRAEVRESLRTALENVKPTDALIVGMYQQFGDQVGENTGLMRELCTGSH